MVDVIDFLERMGKDAELRYASETVLVRALNDAQMTPPARAALLSGDRGEIEAVLSADNGFCCMIYAPIPEEEMESHDSRRQKAVFGNVYCLIYAPIPEGEGEESDEYKRQKAA